MKRIKSEKKYWYLLSHQVCAIIMVIHIFLYDYTVEKISPKEAKFYMIMYIVGLVGCVISLIKATKIEIKRNKDNLEFKTNHSSLRKQGILMNKSSLSECETLQGIECKTVTIQDKVLNKKFENPILEWIDAIYLEELCFICGGIVLFLMWQLKKLDVFVFSLSDIMITSGIIAYMIDSIVLILYFSVVRRFCNKNLYTNSVLYLLKEVFIEDNNLKGVKEVSKKNRERQMLKHALENIATGNLEIVLDETEFHGREQEMAKSINRIQEGMKAAVSSKIRTEKLKADLITNVSHDIKTPLTSIVNYVELLQRENLENDNAKHYIQIIEKKAQRLKQLTEDLVEVSKISSGNIKLDIQEIDFVELVYQIGGEFNEKFESRSLTIVTKLPNESVLIRADGRQLYRAIENLYSNAAKYAFESTNVYIELVVEKEQAIFSIRNVYGKIVEGENGSYVDLTERFVRGEVSRTTEGSGLGLSIAKSLIMLMGGSFYLKTENGLFTAVVEFPVNHAF